MSARRGARRVIAALLVLAAALPAGYAWAEEAPGDSLMQGYIRGLSDSTDRWYGATVAPLDTTGLDSALTAGLAAGPRGGRRRSGNGFGTVSFSPALGFQRVDGGQLGIGANMSAPQRARVSGRLQYTTGTHDWLGEGRVARSWRIPGLDARAEWFAAAGRRTESFDRDHYDATFTTIFALLSGSDRHQYVRRDGFRSRVALVQSEVEGSLEWRDELESSLPYTTDWTLFGSDPELPSNAAAAFGRARELGLTALGPIPGTRFRWGANYWTSGRATGSDFTYRRLRIESGGDVSLGRHFALVSQGTYGRLRGQALPQEAFFLGGVHSIRSFKRNERTGTGHLFARTDLVLVDDLPQLLNLPLPAWLPLQGSVFAASGALWGSSPDGQTAAETRRDLPRANEWWSEAGVGLAWRPGLPDPEFMLRIEYAWPIGPDAREPRLTFAFQRYLDLLPASRD